MAREGLAGETASDGPIRVTGSAVKTCETCGAQVYTTPQEVIDFAAGSGAFLSNPPFTALRRVVIGTAEA